MRAGRLRHRITIQQQAVTGQNDYGEDIYEWTDVAIVWAEVQPLTGREYWAAEQVNAETTHQVRLRYLSDIEPSMRILFGSRVLVIESVFNVDERDRELVVTAREDA